MRLIDKDALIEEIERTTFITKELDNVFEAIENAPIIENRPKGEWVGISYDGYADGSPVYDEWECSNCGHEIRTENTPPYCEMCGADMIGK